ncbi:MAG TPA: ATP-binding protein [Acidimicrobiales bacterium]|nr:ATP-binding protein [Acidimicrobiales bacterium]
MTMTAQSVGTAEGPAPESSAEAPTGQAPEAPSRRQDLIRRVALVCGLLTAMLGLLEMLAWYLRLSTVLRFGSSSFAPIMFNTALALTLTGAALALAASGRVRWLAAAGLFDVTLATAVVVQHVTGWGLGIDELFVRAYLIAPDAHPGRLPVNTAVALAIIGAAFLFVRLHGPRPRPFVLVLAAAIMSSIALVTLFGYAADIPTATGWFALAAMAIPAAIAILLLATGLLALAWTAERRTPADLSEWLAVPAGIASFSTVAFVWLAMVNMSSDAMVTKARASQATLFVAGMAGVLLAVTTSLGQRANRRRREAEALAQELRVEAQRRSEAEATARQSEHTLFQFLEAMPVGVFVADTAGRPYYANGAAARLMGRGVLPAEVDTLATVYEAFEAGRDDPYPVERMPLVRALHGEISHIDDMEVRRPDGRVALEVWGCPITEEASGDVRFAITAFADISDRLARQRRLNEQAALLDMAHDAIFIRDAHRRITFWNHGAEDLYGWSGEEALGSVSYDLLRTTFPRPIEEIEAELRREDHWSGEVVQYTRDGRELTVETRWAAEFGADGSVVAVMAINTDVTARKAAEQEARRRAEQLEVANQELNRSNDELAQFAYVASHDLSEPLRAISGPVSLLARRYQGRLDPDADQLIAFTVDGCQRMQTLISDLLAFSRVGRVEAGVVDVDMDGLLATVLTGLAPMIDERRAIVTTGQLPVLRAEPTQAMQLFQNLLANAIKFTAPDEIPCVHVGCERDGEAWRFTVTDNGIGIEPRHRERVFGMFKRLHARDAFPGTGIGLALCKKIVERHGGTIGVDDGPGGCGSTFWFTLPTKEGAHHDGD